MRVIGGTAGGRKLVTPKGNRVRPTADRVKEALFSILLSRYGSLNGLTVIDLFAGTGNLGIEALSRGATHATFVDSHPQSREMIRKNLTLTGLADRAELVSHDVLTALQRLTEEQRNFDIVFIDPPYRELELMQKVLEHLAGYRLTTECGLIVLESDGKSVPTLPDGLVLLEKRVYGDTALHLLEKAE